MKSTNSKNLRSLSQLKKRLTGLQNRSSDLRMEYERVAKERKFIQKRVLALQASVNHRSPHENIQDANERVLVGELRRFLRDNPAINVARIILDKPILALVQKQTSIDPKTRVNNVLNKYRGIMFDNLGVGMWINR